MESLYDLSWYPIEHRVLELGEWNAWADKMQRDYRWGQVSDLNSETILFPDVDDPWMFTEYVFQGVGSGEAIAEPPLYSEQTMRCINAERETGERARRMVCGWGAPPAEDEVEWSSSSGDEKRLPPQIESSQTEGQVVVPVADSGVILYPVRVNVESVKWGEHGNVPPGSIDMAAPKEWMDAGRGSPKIRPTYVAHLGSPYYARSYGVVYWHNHECYIEPTEFYRGELPPQESSSGSGAGAGSESSSGAAASDSGSSSSSEVVTYWSYPVRDPAEEPGVCQCVPRAIRDNRASRRDGAGSAGAELVTGQLSHGGCVYMRSGSGKTWCAAEQYGIFDPHMCGAYDTPVECPHYQPGRQYPLLISYETTAKNLAQWNQDVAGIYSDGSSGINAADRARAANIMEYGAAFGMALNFMNFVKIGRPDIYNWEDLSVWYELSFEIEYTSAESARLNKRQSSNDQFGRGIRVVRGSGRRTLDTKENSGVFKGDTPYFGDMDQRGFSRWMEMPMFCASEGYCCDDCAATQKAGYRPGEPAGGPGECRYYRGKRCPTTGVNKRAIEFQECMVRCSAPLEELGRMWAAMKGSERDAYNASPESPYYFLKRELYHDDSSSSAESSSAAYSGNDEDPGDVWDIYGESEKALGGVAYTDEQNIERGGSSKKLKRVGRVQITRGGQLYTYFWWRARDNAGTQKAIWLCRTDPHFVKATRHTVIVENQEKFIGGFHPQYKDYGKMGPEYIQDVLSTSYRDAAGDDIGDSDYQPQPQYTNKKGYWTDADGEYIMDERDLGLDQPILGDGERESVTDSPPTISFKKSNTTIDVETGKRTKPKTENCAVHTNDPAALLRYYRTNGSRRVMSYYDASDNLVSSVRSEGRPTYQDEEGRDYWAPPYVGDYEAVPTMRRAAHCPVCDYYLSFKYYYEGATCPWCESRLEPVSGDEGWCIFNGGDSSGSGSGSTGAESGSGSGGGGSGSGSGSGVTVAPEPTELIGKTWPQDAPVIKKLLKVKAIGRVTVWAPPGTCVPLDGFYWHHPTVVTNTLIRQLKQRLGTYVDGAWQCNTMSPASELTGGYPRGNAAIRPLPPFKSVKDDENTAWQGIEWEGVTMEDRARYASWLPAVPARPIPGLDYDTTRENLILPYTKNEGDGLKVITQEEIIALRNRIEPVLAYCSELPSNRDYPRFRASYEQREKPEIPRYVRATACRVPSTILAANENGVDSFVQFWSGDDEIGAVREYYPPGLSWWWLNQVIGGKYSDLTGGHYHMDDGSPISGGHRCVAKCAMFINGILPLDKEIVAAYLLISPAGEPYKEPIGRGWNGVMHYEHYHGMKTEHYGDGRETHLHGQAGTNTEYDMEGNEKLPQPAPVEEDDVEPESGASGGAASGGGGSGGGSSGGNGGGSSGGSGGGSTGGETGGGSTTEIGTGGSNSGSGGGTSGDPSSGSSGGSSGEGGSNSGNGASGQNSSSGSGSENSGSGGGAGSSHSGSEGSGTSGTGGSSSPSQGGTDSGQHAPAGVDFFTCLSCGLQGFGRVRMCPSCGSKKVHLEIVPSNEVVFEDEGDYRGWGAKSSRPTGHRSLYSDHFTTHWSGLAGVKDMTFWYQHGTVRDNVSEPGQDAVYVYRLNLEGREDQEGLQDTGLTYLAGSGVNTAQKFRYVGVDEEGRLRALYTKDEIWQEHTQTEFKDTVAENTVTVTFSAGDGSRDHEVSRTFTQFTEKFVNSIYPDQMQGIAGYFDFSSLNASKRLASAVKMRDRSETGTLDHPVIYQEEESEGGVSLYAGESKKNEGGIVTRALDVTDLVRSLYNTRIKCRFRCRGGISLKELFHTEFPEPVWNGSGEWERRARALSNNAQVLAEDKNSQQVGPQLLLSQYGYLLNDGRTLPEVEEDRTLPEVSPDGDEYTLAESYLEIRLHFTLPVIIKEDNNDGYNIYLKGEKKPEEDGRLGAKQYDTTTELVQDALNGMFALDGASLEVLNDHTIILKIEGSEGLVVGEAANECYDLFGLKRGTYYPRQRRCYSFTGCVDGYDPHALMLAYGVVDYYPWVTNTYRYETQKALIDLVRAPLILSEQDYRYTAGYTDCASCRCPNQNCAAYGMTIAEFNETHDLQYSQGQTSCPSCGKDLTGEEGAVVQPGDGIYTWNYDEPFAPNAYIRGFDVEVEEGQSYSVSFRRDGDDYWKCVLDVRYISAREGYVVGFENKTIRYETYSELPKDFQLAQPFRARYARLSVEPVRLEEEKTFDSPVRESDYVLRVDGNFREIGDIDLRNTDMLLHLNEDRTQTLPVAATKMSDDFKTLRIYSFTVLPRENIEYLSFTLTRYTTTARRFRVWGHHYQESKLKVTPPATSAVFAFKKNQNLYRMKEYPTQIRHVSVGRLSGGGAYLAETDDPRNAVYTLRETDLSDLLGKQGAKAYVITGGYYYFNPSRNRIELPKYGVCNDTVVSIKSLETEIEDNELGLTFYPDMVTVEYWTGSGMELTLEAEALTRGPSHQIERGTITVIEGVNTADDSEVSSSGDLVTEADALPDNGQTVMMPDMDGGYEKREIPWTCYNHEPATIDYDSWELYKGGFLPPNLMSTALGDHVDDDSYFLDMFGENNSAIGGKCKTQVTFYGAPDQVVSGEIIVSAPKKRTRTIDFGGGKKVVENERTGGIAQGGFIVKCVVEKCKGRQTLAYSKPTLVVFARERHPSEPLEDET